jgi:hypothetical protein
MQLISILLLVFSTLLFVGAIVFVTLWHRTYRKCSLVQMLREDISHIGVSAIVTYPDTPAPLIALLEEEYPHSEAVIITDLQSKASALGELVRRYHLIKVNHSHLEGVRALYRSRRRAFRRVVMVDLPMEYSERASTVGREVASYENLLCLKGESIVERNSISYCANVAALQSLTDRFSLHSFVGAEACFERGEATGQDSVVCLRAERPLAWSRGDIFAALLALLLPSLFVVIACLSESRLIMLSAVITTAVVVLFAYVSSWVTTEKSLFARLDTVLHKFYRFWSMRLATRQESKILDTLRCPSQAQGQNRPARYREDARPER